MGKRNKKKQQNKRQNNKKKKHYNGKHPESQQQNAIFDNLEAAEHILNDQYTSKTNNNNKNYNKNNNKRNKNNHKQNNNNNNKKWKQHKSNYKSELNQFKDQLRPLGLGIRNARSDGNCLFRAISDQISGDENNQSRFRHQIVLYMREHNDEFAPFYVGNYDSYLTKMSKNGIWGGNMELTAAAKTFHVDIIIHSLNAARYEILYQTGKPKRTIHLSYHNERHYASVRRLDDMTSNKPAKIINLDKNYNDKLQREQQRAEIAWCHNGGNPLQIQNAKNDLLNLSKNEQLVVARTNCYDIIKVKQALKYLDGNIDAAVENILVDMSLMADKQKEKTIQELEKQKEEEKNEKKKKKKKNKKHKNNKNKNNNNKNENENDKKECVISESKAEPQKQEDHIWPISLIVNQAYASTFACVKCKDIPKLCMTDDDGEILCNKCAENVDNTTPNKAVQKMVNKLKTKCLTLSQDPNYIKQKNNNEEAEGVNILATQISNKSKCDWIGQIQDYDTHSKECQFIIINCSQCKIFKCQRKLLDKHMIKCPQVKINCPLSCGVIILRKNKTIHIENDCMEQILNCTNDDCKEELKRKDFKHHVENVCDTRIVECKFKQFGCNIGNIKAKQLNTHMNNYKFEHLSNKFDAVTNKFSTKVTEQQETINKFGGKITEQQKTIDDMKAQLEEKESGIDKLNKCIEAMVPWINLSMTGMVHNYDVSVLVNTGWKCVYDKPYSHGAKTNELRRLCGQNKDIFVGGYHKDNKNNIILGAFGPSSVVHQFIGSETKAVIPSDVTYKSVYKVYWYHVENTAFGFASVSKVNVNSADIVNTNGDDRLSWFVEGSGGYRLGSKTGLSGNDYYKIIYIK